MAKKAATAGNDDAMRAFGDMVRDLATASAMPEHCFAPCRRARLCVAAARHLHGGKIPARETRLMETGLPPCAALQWDALQPILHKMMLRKAAGERTPR